MNERAELDTAVERLRQFRKWGVQNHPPLYWLAILVEEVGEVGKALAEHDHSHYREELVHVAAVAQQAIDSYDRNGGK